MLQSPVSQGPTHSSFTVPGHVGPAFICEHLKSKGTLLSAGRLLILGLQLSFPQWWDFRRSGFPHAMAQILPVGKTTSGYSLLGTEVMSIPKAL